MLRNPYEIARSLATRNGFSLNKSLLLSLIHLLDGEAASRGYPRVVVTYNELMADWRKTVSKIGQSLDVQWLRSLDEVQPEVSEFLDPNLRHHVAADRERQDSQSDDADAVISGWAQRMYEIFAGAQGDLSNADKVELDQIRSELLSEMPRLELWREQRSFGRQLMVLEDWGKGLEKKRQALETENLHLRREIEHRDLLLEGFRTSHGQGPGSWWTFGQTKLKGLLQTLEEKEAEIVQLNVLLQEVKDSQAWFSEQYETVRKDREKREENIARLTEALASQQSLAEEIAADRDQLQVQLEQQQSQIHQLQARIDQLSATLQARETSAQKLRVWIQQLELERIQKNDQIQKLEQEMRQLPEKL
jgi:septal ring factor EnvC (AmiA/AmiB activator)